MTYQIFDCNTVHERNLAIEECLKNNVHYAILKTPSINMHNSITTIRSYIDMMKKYKLGMMFYGYYNKSNYVLNNPNPAVILSSNDGDIYLTRYAIPAFIILDINMVKIKFDENLTTLWFDWFIQQCVNNKYIPLNGIYFEIPRSWEHFLETDEKFSLNKTNQNVSKDAKYLNDNKYNIAIENNIDKIINYIKDLENGK